MDLFTSALDLNSAEDGEWVAIKDMPKHLLLPHLPPGMDDIYEGVSLKCRSSSARSVQDALISSVKAQQGDDAGAMEKEALLAVTKEVMISAALIDWKGVKYKGKPLKYRPDIGRALLDDPEYQHFYRVVDWACSQVKLRFHERELELEKNS